jgi:hypothetical protein
MTLSYDTDRCHGYDNPVCEGCRRLEPGRPEYQSYIYIAEPVGECRYRIGKESKDLRGEGKR